MRALGPEELAARGIGWRSWRIADREDDGPVLVSPFRGTKWPGPTLEAETWFTGAAVWGKTGVHASYTLNGDLPPGDAHGRVRVPPGAERVAGTVGWRAERVVVDYILLVGWDEVTADGLERRYRCDVRPRWPGARIDPGALIAPSARVDHGAWVGKNARVGRRARIGEGAWIESGARVGEEATIGPRARVESGTLVPPGDVVEPGRGIQLPDGFGRG